MRNAKGHIDQAKSNEQLAEFLDGTPYLDWRASSLFYAAVHYIQAYFFPKTFGSHVDREAAIQSERNVSAVWDDYRALKDWSMRARYLGEKPSDKDFKSEILPSLLSIKKHLKSTGVDC